MESVSPGYNSYYQQWDIAKDRPLPRLPNISCASVTRCAGRSYCAAPAVAQIARLEMAGLGVGLRAHRGSFGRIFEGTWFCTH